MVCVRVGSARLPSAAMTEPSSKLQVTKAALVGVPAAMVALLGIEIVVALSGEYHVDVDYVVDQHVGSPSGDGRTDPFRLVILGDSTAAGVGADNESTSLPVQIARRVARGSGRMVHVTGFGVSGARTSTVLTEQVPLLPHSGMDGSGIDAVVIVVGSNDVTHVTPPWSLTQHTRDLMNALRTRTGAPVILGGIPRFAGVDALAQPLRGLTDRYAGVLRTRQEHAVEGLDGVTFVDIASLASPRFIGRPEAMSSDAFHPSGVGYGFWADALAPPVTVIAARGDNDATSAP